MEKIGFSGLRKTTHSCLRLSASLGWRTILLFLIVVTVHSLHAQYPEKNIRVIVHVPPGGGTDNMARLVLQHAGRRLGATFVIENFKGAGGQVGYSTLAMAIPDGYTIGTITTTSIVTHELTRKSAVYRLEESFIPIARVVHDPAGLFVRTESPLKSFEDLRAKARLNPKTISCGGSSIWGTHHVHSMMLAQRCEIQLNYIPFDGGSEVRNNLLGGHIEVAAGGVSEFLSLIRAGKVRPLVIAAKSKLDELPDVPTYHDFGYDLIMGSDRGFAAPAGTPAEYVEILSQAIQATVEDSTFLVSAEKISLAPILAYKNAVDFKQYLHDLKMNIRELVILMQEKTRADQTKK